MIKINKMSNDNIEDPSSAKLKFIGSLDLILVVSLVTFVVFTIIIPISPYSNGHPNNIDDGSTSSTLYYGHKSVGGGPGVDKPGGPMGKQPQLKITTPFVFFSFLALLVVFGLLGILSSMVLIKAASLEAVDKTEKTNMVAFALHGILASSFILGICVWYIIAAWVEPLEHSSNLVMTTSLILFLFCLVVRLTFALVIWKERKNISGEAGDTRVLDLETLRQRCGQVQQRYQDQDYQQCSEERGGGRGNGNNVQYKDWLEGRKFMTTSFRDKWQNPVINLAPYRGSNLSMIPQCQCASSQGCVA